MAVTEVGASLGVAFLVGATVVADMVAKACSSPQTAELNADKRAPTLMKWVNIGLVEGALFVAVAALIDKRHARAIVAGGALEALITYVQYAHAKDIGLRNGGHPTEEY